MYENSTKTDATLAYTFFTIYSESNLKRFWLKNFLYGRRKIKKPIEMWQPSR